MRCVGYSTGSLAYGDFKRAISLLLQQNADAIELSALRESELNDLIESLEDLDLTNFTYVSIHAPSKLQTITETELVATLKRVLKKKYFIIVHPDIIQNFEIWNELGNWLCIENMDNRKPIGQTTEQLEQIFLKLPKASFCLDVGHAKQIDSLMEECKKMINKFANKLVQIHLSDVDSNSTHHTLTNNSVQAFSSIAKQIHSNIPIILESPITETNNQQERIKRELNCAAALFDRH